MEVNNAYYELHAIHRVGIGATHQTLPPCKSKSDLRDGFMPAKEVRLALQP